VSKNKTAEIGAADREGRTAGGDEFIEQPRSPESMHCHAHECRTAWTDTDALEAYPGWGDRRGGDRQHSIAALAWCMEDAFFLVECMKDAEIPFFCLLSRAAFSCFIWAEKWASFILLCAADFVLLYSKYMLLIYSGNIS
jgi:hypothetical protein